jgi:hypothetical protein
MINNPLDINQLDEATRLSASKDFPDLSQSNTFIQKLSSVSFFCYKIDLLNEALKHYSYGAAFPSTLQLSYITGAMRTLRKFGYRERMHQMVLR